MKLKIHDKVELLRDELLDDNYLDHKKTVVAKGTIMSVIAIAPKVRMTKGVSGTDNNPYFLNLVLPNNNNRVRTNFCNVRKVK